MSRRKAGCVPRRVDPEPDEDDMETSELVIDVKPEQDGRALAPAPGAPKNLAMPRFLGTERRLGTAPRHFGSRSPWIPMSPKLSDRQPWTDKHPDLLTCGRCLQTFPLEAITDFMDHKKIGCQILQESKELKALSCLQCNKQFPGAWKLLLHAQWDHGLSIYQTDSETLKSPLLGLAEVAAAVSAEAAERPAQDKSPDKPPAVSSAPTVRRSPTCLVCNKTLSSFSNLKVHMRSHTGERPYACDQCPYACAQSSKLNRHKKTHRTVMPSSPSASSREVSPAAPPEPADHAAAPASTLPQQVEKAGAAATAGVQEPGAPGSGAQAGPGGGDWGPELPDSKVPRTDPIKSEKTVSKKTSKSTGKSRGPGGSCEFCGKHFTNSSNLIVHRRTHTGERPYACDQCPYACAQSSKLKRHRRMHGLGPGSTRYKCPHCCVEFDLKATLDKHLWQKHPETA